MVGHVLGGHIMYRPSKKVLAQIIAAGLIMSSAGIVPQVHAASEQYNAKSVGISDRLDEYIESSNGNSVDDLLITPDPIEVAGKIFNATSDVSVSAQSGEKSDGASVTDATTTDATATDASATNAIVANKYPQFNDRAVAITSGNLNIRTEASTDSDIVGTLPRGGVCLVKEKGDTWSYIASGSCYGYVLNDYLAFGDNAGEFEEANGTEKVAKINTTTLKVHENADENSDVVALVPEGESYTVLSRGDNWTEILVDDSASGFVKNEYVDLQYDTARAVSVAEQQAIDAQIEAAAVAAANAANSKTNTANATGKTTTNTTNTTTTKSTGTQTANANVQQSQTVAAAPVATTAPATTAAPVTTAAPAYVPTSSTGASAASYACQFVGNSYVWGGTSLTNGADCSGFTMSVYAQFGVSLPHNAAAQSSCGTEVSLSAIQPGDLLFYSNGGGISHVAMYIGNGMVVHAASTRDGIKISSYNYNAPVKAVRIL